MLRAVVVGFVLGFALVGGMRLGLAGDRLPQLTSAPALKAGVAIDHVADQPCGPVGGARGSGRDEPVSSLLLI